MQGVRRARQKLRRQGLELLAVIGTVILGMRRLLVPGKSAERLGAMGGEGTGGCNQRRREVCSTARCQVAAAGGCRRAPAQSQRVRCLCCMWTGNSASSSASAAFETGTLCRVLSTVRPASLLLLEPACLLLLEPASLLLLEPAFLLLLEPAFLVLLEPAFLLLLKLAFLLLLNASQRFDSERFQLGYRRRLPVRRGRLSRPWQRGGRRERCRQWECLTGSRRTLPAC